MKIIFYLLISVNVVAKDIILLLGGIYRPNATYMKKIKNALLKEKRIIIDDLNTKTLDYKINQQAEHICNDLINKKGITSSDRIVIIGHSQGG